MMIFLRILLKSLFLEERWLNFYFGFNDFYLFSIKKIDGRYWFNVCLWFGEGFK